MKDFLATFLAVLLVIYNKNIEIRELIREFLNLPNEVLEVYLKKSNSF